MISLLTCCKTRQSMIEKSTIIARDTTTISRVAAKDSTSQTAKIDSIIIEEYTADDRGVEQTTEGHNKPDHKVSPCQKRNDTSQKGTGSLKKKTKIYAKWYRADNTCYVIKMLYNVAFGKEVIRKNMIELVKVPTNMYWGFFKLTDSQFNTISKLGEVDERYIID